MDILSVNAEQKLAHIVATIGQSPQSWQGWSCLHIEIVNSDYEGGDPSDGLLWIKSILASYLNEIEGKIYFCSNRDVHIICKNIPEEILREAAGQIVTILEHENGLPSAYTVYDLSQSGFEYARRVFEAQDNILSFPALNQTSLLQAEISVLPSGKDPDIKTSIITQENLKVLLVEDDAVTRWMVRNILKDVCEFVTAPTANKVFSLLPSFQPDIVFLDIDLPDKNGKEVLEWIMRQDPGARVVMFSSNNDMDSITESLDGGASGFVSKPFLKENLLHYVHENGCIG